MKVSLICSLWSVFPNVQCMHIALVLTVSIASDSLFSLTTITQKPEYEFKVSVSAADSKRFVRFCLEAKLPLHSPHHSDCSRCPSLRVDLQSVSLFSTVLHHTTPLSSCTPIFTVHPSSDAVLLNLSPESVVINHFSLFSHFPSSVYCFLLSCHAHNIHNAYFRIIYMDTRSKAIKEKQMLPPTVSPLKPKQTINHDM